MDNINLLSHTAREEKRSFNLITATAIISEWNEELYKMNSIAYGLYM